MSELHIVRKKIQGDFFLEKSYKEGKLFYEVLRYKDDYIGINYGYLDNELREETYINDNRIGMLIANEKDKIYICTLDGKRHEVGITVCNSLIFNLYFYFIYLFFSLDLSCLYLYLLYENLFL